MIPLPPWANGPFELLVHAEGHWRGGEDFDRRIALISFDNAIEVAITTYLTLNPMQRSGRSYSRSDVDKWLNNYYSRLELLDTELISRGQNWEIPRSHILWAHDHRNEQYHGGHKGTPEKYVLVLIRKAGLWIFSFLFEICDAEERLEQAIAGSLPPPPPQHDASIDRTIDSIFGMIEIGEQSYYTSEVLFSVDYAAYREVGARLCQAAVPEEAKDLPL